jgi:DNA-binding MarR family transcriptional regulator
MSKAIEPIYDADTYQPRKSIRYLVERVKGEIMAALDRELAQSPELAALEITAAQYVMLMGLAAEDQESTSHLCHKMSYDPGAMTRMVDRLEAKGLVRRRRCPDDRRVVNLDLTEEGRASVPKMRTCAAAVMNRFVRGFSKEEVRQLESFLTRMIGNA